MSREQQRALDALVAIEQRYRVRHCRDVPADAPTLVRGTDQPGGRHAA